jgi:DNA-binding NarL/FixJ family response regulator
MGGALDAPEAGHRFTAGVSHEPAPFEMREPPRVAVVSDDPLVRAAFNNLLGGIAALAIVDDADDADLLLWDAGVDPERAAERLAELDALATPAVALVEDEAHASEALASGARGVVLRGADGARLAAALIAAHHGLTVVDASFTDALLPEPEPRAEAEGHLTAREREVLRLVADGLSNKRIAKTLAISEHTAKFHVNSILGKLDARTRTEAVVVAARRGLILL